MFFFVISDDERSQYHFWFRAVSGRRFAEIVVISVQSSVFIRLFVNYVESVFDISVVPGHLFLTEHRPRLSARSFKQPQD